MLIIDVMYSCALLDGGQTGLGLNEESPRTDPTRMTVFAHEQLRTPQNRRKMDLERSTPSGHFLWE